MILALIYWRSTTQAIIGIELVMLRRVSALTGYALAKYRYPLLNWLLIFVIGTMMIPWDGTLIPVYLTVRSLGMIDTYWALIVVDLMSPFGIFLMRQICVDIPNELTDAARVDGASEFGIWRRIVLPNVTAGLVTLALFDFQATWNSFYWPLLVISSLQRYYMASLVKTGLKW